MKVLVDTSVWSLSLRRSKAANLNREDQRHIAALTDAIANGRVAMIGPIRQELLSGIKETSQYEKLKTYLRNFRDEALRSEDFEVAARLYNLCRSRGVECGPIDMLIFAVAVDRNWEILFLDAGLERCREVVRSASESRRRP